MPDNQPTILFEIDNDNLVRIRGNKKVHLAKLDTENKIIYWKDDETRDNYHKSATAFFSVEKIHIETVLIEGQKPDLRPKNAPQPPAKHKMQGDLTPAYLDDLLKYEPVKFQNLLGVKLKVLKEGDIKPTDPRDLWVRADVIRTDVRPNTFPFNGDKNAADTHGGEYISTRFKMKDQIIARRRSHLTFEEKEIFRGDLAEDQAEPYTDPYEPKKLEQMEKRGIDNGGIEIVWKRQAAATMNSQF